MLVLFGMTACKDEAQRQREMTACIGAGTDEVRGQTDPYKVGWCLENRFAWKSEDVQKVQVQISVIERQIRAERDSIVRARRSRKLN
jgi:hypothetical protein